MPKRRESANEPSDQDLLERMIYLQASLRPPPTSAELEQLVLITNESSPEHVPALLTALNEAYEAEELAAEEAALEPVTDGEADWLAPGASEDTLHVVKALASMPRPDWQRGQRAASAAVWKAFRELDYVPGDEHSTRPTRISTAFDRRLSAAEAKVAADVRRHLRRATDELAAIAAHPMASFVLGSAGMAAIAQIADANVTLLTETPEPGDLAHGGRRALARALAPLRAALDADQLSLRAIARALLASDRDWTYPPCPGLVESIETSVRSNEEAVERLEKLLSKWFR